MSYESLTTEELVEIGTIVRFTKSCLLSMDRDKLSTEELGTFIEAGCLVISIMKELNSEFTKREETNDEST